MKLYINGKEADLSDSTVISLTYKVSDVSSPTAVKNSFSKTITLDSTPNNNRIFGEIYNLDLNVGGNLMFDVRKRVDALIEHNGELIEKGYISLDNISRTGGDIKYNLTFYGELGNIFYNLMYDEDGNERTLKDLYFGWKSTKAEEDDSTLFEMDKDFVIEGWRKLYNEALKNGSVSDNIVAIPTYSGYYEDFDSDKVLVDVDSIDDDDIQAYFPDITDAQRVCGYGLVKLPRECTEWEMKDLRSHYQRCGIKLSFLLETICKPENNGGYEIVFSDEIKNSPYYRNTYIMFNRFTYDETSRNAIKNIYMSGLTFSGSTGLSGEIAVTNDDGDVFDCTDFSRGSLKMTFNTSCFVNDDWSRGGVFTCAIYEEKATRFQGWLLSFDLYDADTNEYISSTDSYVWNTTSRLVNLDREYPDWKSRLADFYGIDENRIVYSNMVSLYDGNGKYDFSFFSSDRKTKMSIIANLPRQRFKIKLKYQYFRFDNNTGGLSNLGLELYGFRKDERYWQYGLFKVYHDGEYQLNFSIDEEESYYSESFPPESKLLYNVDKNVLFGKSSSPFDYLISFAKLFNLKFRMDDEGKVLRVMRMEEYYKDETVNIDQQICRDKEMTITPTLVENKWIEMNMDTPESYAQYLYNKKNKGNYGEYKMDTGYYFNNDTKKLFEDNIYQNAIPYQISSFYLNIVKINDDEVPKAIMSPTFEYTLWDNNNNTKSVTTYGTGKYNIPPTIKDITPKLCLFDKDGEYMDDFANALVFYDGYRDYDDTYYISNNIKIMEQLNEKMCFYWSQNGSGIAENASPIVYTQIAKKVNRLPNFSKYKSSSLTGDTYFEASLDFSYPKASFITRSDLYTADCTIYKKFWERYINDLYDINSKKITLYTFLKDKPREALRKFYYFDNMLWILNEVIDYNPESKEPVKCEFVRVNSKNNYIFR